MIGRKSFLIVTSSFFTQLIGWIGLVILVKLWGNFAPEALGIIGFAMAFLSIFNYVADLGFSSAHIKRISEGKNLGTCIGTYATTKILLIGIMVTIVFAALFIMKNVLQKGFTDATTESVVIIFLVYYVFLNLQQIVVTTFNGTKEIAKRVVTTITESVIKMPLTIVIALAGVSILGKSILPAADWPEFLQPLQQFIANHAVGSLAMTYVFGLAASVFVGMYFLRKYSWKRPNWTLFKSYFSFALPIMLISIVGVISTNIDKLMIGYFWTSTEVGYYFTMQRILAFVNVFPAAVASLLFPTISEYHFHNSFEKVKQTTLLAERYISMIMIPPIVLIIIFVKPAINILLDSAFLPAAPVLVVLTIYTFIAGLMMPYSLLITGMNRPGTSAKIGAVICIVNISLNYLFIPRQGLLSSFGINGPVGAAVATVLSLSFGILLFKFIAKKLTGLKLLQSHTPRHIIAGLIMGVVLYCFAYMTPLFPVIRWFHLPLFAGIGLTIYIGVLFVLKEFKKQDLHFFLDILRPKEMVGYIKSELKEK